MERAGFSPDGRRVITAARDGTARIWDAVPAQLTVLQPVGRFPTAVFDPNGDRVLTAAETVQASLWDARTGDEILSVTALETRMAGFSPDGRSFATSHTTEGLRLERERWRADP